MTRVCTGWYRLEGDDSSRGQRGRGTGRKRSGKKRGEKKQRGREPRNPQPSRVRRPCSRFFVNARARVFDYENISDGLIKTSRSGLPVRAPTPANFTSLINSFLACRLDSQLLGEFIGHSPAIRLLVEFSFQWLFSNPSSLAVRSVLVGFISLLTIRAREVSTRFYFGNINAESTE